MQGIQQLLDKVTVVRPWSDFHSHFVISAQGSAAVKQAADKCLGGNLCTSCHEQSPSMVKSITDTVLHTDDATEPFISRLDNECYQCRQGL